MSSPGCITCLPPPHMHTLKLLPFLSLSLSHTHARTHTHTHVCSRSHSALFDCCILLVSAGAETLIEGFSQGLVDVRDSPSTRCKTLHFKPTPLCPGSVTAVRLLGFLTGSCLCCKPIIFTFQMTVLGWNVCPSVETWLHENQEGNEKGN